MRKIINKNMRKKNRVSYAQTQLPFDGRGSRSLVVPLRRERQLLAACGVAAGILAVMYGSFVGVSIAAVAEREHASSEARTLTATVAGLERSYLAETRGITEGYAKELGFVPAKDRVYVTRLDPAQYALNAR